MTDSGIDSPSLSESDHDDEAYEVSRLSSYQGPKRLLHWGPLIAIGIILWISMFAISCDLMYWPVRQKGGTVNLSIFITWVFLVFYHHYKASTIGPGFVPLKWKPINTEDCKNLQFCQVCQGYKAPRSHHCRKCNRCVMKMDHHCPWINICCGHMNHANFTYFLFFAPIGCMHAFSILVASLYYGLNLRWYLAHGTGTEPLVRFNLVTLVGSMFAVGLAFGVTISVGILFIIQIKSIIKNRTGIEEWIEQKAEYRERDGEFVFPYDLGCMQNINQVLFTSDGWPKSNGFWWEVREGCGQFDLTVEQILQKKEKKQRALEYVAVKSYSGYFFPIVHGLCVCCCVPWSDEPRISVKPGDKIWVTRWRRHWLYGDKVIKRTESDDWSMRRERGWFPRRCVIEVDEHAACGDKATKSSRAKKAD